MKTISFSCPKCNFQMAAETIYCGQIARCAQCNSEVQIPQKSEIPAPSPEVIAHVDKRDNVEKTFSMLPIFLWTLAGLQLACFILLFCISFNTKSSPGAYEYKIQSYDRYYKRDFEHKMQELGQEGWEYIGTLNENDALLRRVKTKASQKKENK